MLGKSAESMAEFAKVFALKGNLFLPKQMVSLFTPDLKCLLSSFRIPGKTRISFHRENPKVSIC